MKRLWVLVGVICALLFITVSNHAQSDRPSHEGGHQEQASADEPGASLGGVEVGVGKTGSSQRAEASAREEPQEVEGAQLTPQERAADATVSLKWAAWVTAGISFAGVLVVAGTLRYAIKAVGEAKRAADQATRGADAAFDAVKETRRIGETETRAYLSIYSWENSVVDGPEKKLLVIPLLRNSGKSPGIVDSIKTRVEYITPKDRPPPKTGIGSRIVVDPGGSIQAYRLSLTEAEIYAILPFMPYTPNQQECIKLTIDVRYWDIFGNRTQENITRITQVFRIRVQEPLSELTDENLREKFSIDGELISYEIDTG